MTGIWFDDAELGMRFDSPGRTITEADLVNFSGLSGDYSELHTDAELMKESQFGQRIAHGALILSIMTGLRSRNGTFQGTTIAFAEIRNWKFLAPVFIGDTIRVVSEISELRKTSKPDRGVIVHHVKVLTQRDTVTQEGELVTMIKRREAT
jgi:acyl dehydratase